MEFVSYTVIGGVLIFFGAVLIGLAQKARNLVSNPLIPRAVAVVAIIMLAFACVLIFYGIKSLPDENTNVDGYDGPIIGQE